MRASISAKGSAVVAVSGGSAATRLAGVASSQPPIDWARVHVFLADERCVPEDSPDSNLKSIREAFAAAVKLPKSQLYPIPGSATPQASAEGYEKTLRALPEAVLPRDSNGMPIFDVVVLGLGPETHTASLFPNAPTLAPTRRAFLGVANSPKPPPARCGGMHSRASPNFKLTRVLRRVTLSLSAINAARLVLFVVGARHNVRRTCDVLTLVLFCSSSGGADKAEALQRVLEVQALPGALPAQAVRPAAGALRWLIDASAAAQLNTAAWDKPAAWPRSQVPSPSKV